MIPASYFDIVILLVAATIMGVLANYLRQPTLIAYLLAGLLVGPTVLGLIEPSEITEILAEFGLMFLLFLVGLELSFKDIEHMIKPIISISLANMIFLASLGFVTSYILGFSLESSIIFGLAFMYSSTAVVIKLLNDSNELSKQFGKLNTGNLLIEDIVVVLLMIILTSFGEAAGTLESIISSAIFLLLAIPITLLASRKVLPKLVNFMAVKKIPLFITSIFWLFIFVLAAELSGMSIEIGAFIAGLGLGQLKTSVELREEMRSLTNFFIAFFFLNFGLNLSVGDFLHYWQEAIVLALLLIFSKFVLISGLTNLFYSRKTSFASGITMTQTSEFSLVFASTAAAAGLLTSEEVGMISLVAIITMSISSYLIINHNKIRNFLFSENTLESDKEDHALILGYEKGLEEILPLIVRNYGDVTIVDDDPSLGELDEEDIEFVFGNVHHDILRSHLGIENADFVMVNISDESLHKEVQNEIDNDCTLFVKGKHLEGNNSSDIHCFEEEMLIGEELEKIVENKLQNMEETNIND